MRGDSLLLVAALAACPAAADSPVPEDTTIRVMRVTDRRESPLALVVRAETVVEDAEDVAWAIRGLLRDDVFLRVRKPRGRDADGLPTRVTLRLGARSPLTLSRPGQPGRFTVATPDAQYRYFPKDRATRTVSCHLRALIESIDTSLFSAAEELQALHKALGGLFGAADALLDAALPPGRPASPPSESERRLVDLPSTSETEELERMARDELSRALPPL